MVKYNLLDTVNGFSDSISEKLKMHKIMRKYSMFNLKRHIQANKII